MRKLYKLTLLLIVILLGNNVFAYDFSAVCSVGQTLYYNITSSEEPYTVEVTSENIEYPYYTTYPTGNLEIPESVEYNSITYSVTRIGDKAFYNCSGITTVTIPNSVTSIGNHAFYCRELTSVIIPNSVISIGENAFSGCGRLTAVYYTGDVAGWCEIFFLSTSSNPLLYAHNLYINNELVIDLVIPETVTEIKNYAFYYATSLTSVIIPNSVTSIGSYAFHDCSGLETIVVESGNSIYDSRDNCNAIIETESNILLVGCKNTIIPNTVTSIGSSAFFDCSGLVSITIPESVTSIGEWAFANCSGLTGSLTIPNSVSSIGDEAFYGCIGFSGVLTISSSVTSIGYSAFYGCGGFENIVVESGNSIYDSRDNCNALIETELNTLLIGCKNTVIPNTVTSISDYAFYNCSGLTSATIPNSVTSIGNSAFEGCTGLIEVTIPDSVTNIGNDAFSGCTGLTTINYNAINCTFDYSAWGMDISLATLNIGENVTNIPDNAFTRLSGIDTVNFNATNCTRMGSESQPVFSHELETLIIGENVTNIPEYAFYNYGNINISIVKFNATNCTSFGRNNGITGNGNISDLIIGENVTNIPDSAFSGCTGLGGGEFVIPNSVTVIGEYAFYGCYGLNGDLTIPNTMTSIGKYAFYGCSGLYGSLTIPNSVTSIGEYTFKDCGVTDITISDSVTSIGNSAFSGCSNLFYVSFNAANCTIMGNSSNPVFGDCPNMTTLYIGENVKNIPNYAFYGCTGLTEITIPDSVTNIGAQAFYNCSGCEVLTIGKSVETIGTDAFSGCNFSTLNYNAANCSSTPFANNTNITSLSIGDGVENIPDEAFSSCTEISGTLIIPSSVTSIGTRAFYRCTSLSSLSLPEYITTISDGAFAYCNGLTGELVIPNSVITIGSEDINSYGAFWHCENLTSLTIGNSVEFIGKSTFQACSSLTSITIPESVTNIELDAFEGCSALTTFNFNAENCTTMGSRSNPAFANCPLFTTLNIGERVKSIPNSAFYGCTGLSEITIPDSVTNIGDYAFYGCSGLISAVIGESTTRIGAYAFNECSSLPEITIPDSVTYIGDRAFADCSTLATVNYNSKNCTYMGGADASAVFSDCTSFTTLNIGERVKSIPDFAFSECRNLTGTLIIPDSVTSIGFRSFYICRGLSSISIPESVTTIGDGAFAYCDGLTGELVIPNSVITIGDENGSWGAFWRCENLTSVTIGNSVETIGKFTFQACSSLTSITIPESVTSIYDKAFEACTALTTVNFNATNCTTMGSSSNPAFADCSLFDTLNIGERVKNIPDYAFYGCTGLTEITIPDSVTSIGDNAFYGCDNIADINMSANTPPELGDQAFTSTTYTTATLWTPCTADETYRNDSQWGQFTDIQNDTTPLVLTAQTADADMGSVAGSGNYSCETEATITATPNQGYRFLSWNDGNEDNPRTITVTKDSTFEAGFRAIHTITAIAGNGGSITPSGETTVDEGGSQSFTITPNECYEIASVMVDGEDVTADLVEGVYTFDNVTTGHTIYATFMQITYTIMASAGNGGTISPYGTAVVACGSDKAFSIVADNGYRISSVLVDGVEAVSELVEGAYTFTNITADHTIYATFDYITYELTIHYVYADNETAVDDHIEYLPEGATYSVISPEIYGYTADRLVVEGTMPANDVEETVYYNANSYTLTIHYVYADNSEAAADYTATVNYGVEYSVVSPEINGYTADQLIVEGTMPAEDVVFTVIYTINIYTITATAGDNGTITPSEITVEEGADANFTITPNDGYRIASVMVDGAENVTEQLVEGVYTFENVTADHTIYATFEEIPAITYTITATAGENGTISPSGEVTVVEGEDEAFVITPAEGYRIASVMVDVSENVTYQLVEGVYTFENVNANHTISATFEEVLLPVADFTTNPVATGGTLNILLGQRVEYTSTSLNAHHILWTFEGADTVESSQNYVPAVGYSEEGVFLTTLVAYNEDETITDTATLTVVVRESSNTILCDNPCPATIDQPMSQTNIPYYAPEELIYNVNESVDVCITIQCTDSINTTLMGMDAVIAVDLLSITELLNIPDGLSYCISHTEMNPTNNAFATIHITGIPSNAGEHELQLSATINGSLLVGTITQEMNNDQFNSDGIEMIVVDEGYKYIRALSNNEEYGTVSGSGTYEEGTEVIITAIPNQGYRFIAWDDNNTDNPRTFIASDHRKFVATFEANPPVADFTTNPVATGGTLNILLGQRVEYTSTSLNTHHILWTFEGADTVESSQNYVPAVGYSEEGVFLTTLVAYNEDETITDTATLTVVVTATRSYTITVVSANEAYGTVTGGGTYEEGAEIVITATPNQGYRFVQWSDDNTENPRTITVTSDSIFIANFVREFADTITLIDYNGNTYDINALLDDDKYVVFDFFFTTDHYSQEEVPDAVALYTRMGCNGGEVIFIGLTMTNSFEPNTIEWYISEFGVTYPIAPLESNPINETLLNNWGVDGSPTYICISPDRSMRELNRPLNYEELVALGAHERDCSNYNTDVYWSCTFEEENPLYTVGQIITSDANWELQTKSDYTGENYFWAMNSTGENHPYGDISDTPDHWMMIDGGGANQDGYDFDSYMEFSGIDLSDAAGPMICFYECSRRFNIPPSMEATVIEVSTDGGATWTRHLVGCEEMNNDNIFAYRRVLIPEAANNSNVTIRFRANRQESVISNYFNNSPTYSDGIFIVHWQVDDITIEETPACDLSIQDARISMFGYIDYRNENALMSLNETRESAYHKYDPYAQSPRKQWTTGNGFAAFNVEVASIGYETVTPMVRIKITNPNGEEIYNKVASGIRPLSFTEGDTIDFASFDEESDSRIFFFEDNENIPIGRYTVDFYVFADGMEDADTTNNHTTQYFDITESTFSMSYNEPTTYSVLNTNSPEDKYGIKFSYNYDDFIQNAGNGNVVIEAYIDEHTSVGTMITGSLYTYQGGDIDDINSYLEDQLAGITIEEDMLGTWINLDIDENLPYMFAYEAYDTLPYTFIIAIGVTEGSLALGSSDVLTSKGNNSLLWSESPVSWNIYGAQLAIRVRELNEYTVNVISANDEYGSVSGGGTFMEGTEIYIYARPNQGYRFVSWNDVNTENPRAIIVTRDSTFVANFEAEPFQQYTITVLSNDEEYGTVTGGGTYDEGTTVTITAIPNIGYCFLTWSDGNMDNPREITVTGDRTYTAYFTASTHVAIDTTVTKYLTIGDRTFYVAGQYSFTIPSNEGCDTIVDLNLHILDEPEAYDISPNPAKSLISISSEKYISFVEFYSTSGRLVMRKEINAYSVEVNVEALMPGVYFVRLYGEDENLPSVQKFVKE